MSKTNKLNVQELGQVFTQQHTVEFMLGLRKNHGSVLEPSCGAGAFSNHIDGCIAIELDKSVKPEYAILMDFFEYDRSNKFDTIIGNPAFVRFQDFPKSTKQNITKGGYDHIFDERSNLYLFFIYKCILHLEKGGELIFITPREFLKATSSVRLNKFIFDQGTITDFVDLGDARLFGNFNPNCVIWRFEKGNKSRITNHSMGVLTNGILAKQLEQQKKFDHFNGQLVFVKNDYTVPFNDLFYVKVGAVSGADDIFKHREGNKRFITSETLTTNKTKRFFYNTEAKPLIEHKGTLMKRQIRQFDKDTWFMWGRSLPPSKGKRIYVNCKTRQANPFFTHNCNNFDGSVLGIFLNSQAFDADLLAQELNKVDWEELGFVCDGRFIFSQKSLEGCYLPKSFEQYRNGVIK